MKTCLFSLLALLFFSLANAQTADEIVSKHLEALGGKEKLSKITSLYVESATEVMGNESSSITTVINGKGYKNEAEFNGQKIIQVVTDKGGWLVNPFAGSDKPEPMPEQQVKSSIDQLILPDPLFNYAERGATVELLGRENVGKIEAYKLKYVNKENDETTFYIDPANWYIVQAVKQSNAMGQNVTITVNYDDYRQTDFGIFMPYVTNIDMGQFALKINSKKIEVNKDIDPGVFDMPK